VDSSPFNLPYFPRDGLLRQVLATYASGLKQAVTLFAPRRQGKTSFVTHELLPAAHEQGWQTIYIDLWKRRSEPEFALVEALEAERDSRKPGIRRGFRVKEIRATAKIPTVDIGATVARDSGHPRDLVLENRLHAALIELVGDRATLLVLDEVQALAGAKREDFVASLRTVIQQLQGRLLVFYTGSSREGLNSMFRQQKAPLFASAMPLHLDDLGQDFIEDRLVFLQERSPVPVSKEALSDVFDRVGKTPEFLNEVILHLIIGGDGNIEQAMSVWTRSHRDAGAGAVLDKLKPLQLALMKLLATPSHPSIYSAEAQAQLKAAIGEETAVTSTRIQGALRRLARLDLVGPTGKTGEYEIEDRALLIQIREIQGYS
jgi:hypothetical protein